MSDLMLLLMSIALLDSTSLLPVAVLPMVAMLAGKRPLLTSLAFLVGLFITYLAFGFLIALGLDAILDRVAGAFVRYWNNPDSLDMGLEGIIGIALLFVSLRKGAGPRRGRKTTERSAFNPWSAFMLGLMMVAVGIPGALPYFGAIDQILRADLSVTSAVVALLWYNVAFILPLLIIVLIGRLGGRRAAAFLERMQEWMDRWGGRTVRIVFALLGLILVADSVAYFLGYQLLPFLPEN